MEYKPNPNAKFNNLLLSVMNDKSPVLENNQKCLPSPKINNISLVVTPMNDGVKEFEEKFGRNMTYSEMRMMWD